MNINRFAFVCGALALTGSVFASENPAYTYWASYKPGTTITLNINDGSTPKGMLETATLKSVTPDGVVLGMKMSMDMGTGTPADSDLPDVTVPKALDPNDAEATAAAEKLSSAPTESVTTPAGTFKAKLIKIDAQFGGATVTTKEWFSTEVPGGLVKSVYGGGEGQPTSTTEAQAISKK